MNLRNCIYIFLGVFVFAFPSCLGSDDETDIIYSSDAQILAFQLVHDSIPGLSKVLYTIDQQSANIYNIDSLAYGLEMPEKAVFNCTTAGYALFLLNEAGEDSTQIASGDSIVITPFINNHSKYFRVYAHNLKTTKDYTLNLRVHMVDPDSIPYTEYAVLPAEYTTQKTLLVNDAFYCFAQTGIVTEIYSSTDALNWHKITPEDTPDNIIVNNISLYGGVICAVTTSGELYALKSGIWHEISLESGLTSVKTILGELPYIPAFSDHVLSLICQSEGELIFVQTDLESVWMKGAVVPDQFPIKDFASASWIKGYNSILMIVGGYVESTSSFSGDIWRTMGDGISWEKISPKMEQGGGLIIPTDAPNVFRYDDRLFMMNGRTGSVYENEVYVSRDEGFTWQNMSEKYSFPEAYKGRAYSSVCVDRDNYIYVFGGENSSDVLTDIWRGRLNRFGFGQ